MQLYSIFYDKLFLFTLDSGKTGLKMTLDRTRPGLILDKTWLIDLTFGYGSSTVLASKTNKTLPIQFFNLMFIYVQISFYSYYRLLSGLNVEFFYYFPYAYLTN